MMRSGVRADSHTGRRLLAALRTLPRDELLEAPTADLLRLSELVVDRSEQGTVGVFARIHLNRDFVSVLVYIPADRLGPETRRRVSSVIGQNWPGEIIARDDSIVELGLARLQFLIAVRPGTQPTSPDRPTVEAAVAKATRRWSDDLHDLLVLRHGEHEGHRLLRTYRDALPEAYKEDFGAEVAVRDLTVLDGLPQQDGLAFTLDGCAADDEADRRLKVFRTGRAVSLARALPIFTQMGIEVLDERPYEVELPDSEDVWIYDFGLRLPVGVDFDARRAANVVDTIRLLWRGRLEQDGFNALVVQANLTWWQANILRCYAKYLRQAGTAFSQGYIEQALVGHPDIACALVELFEARFDPAREDDDPATQVAAIEAQLAHVSSLDQDSILRSLLALVLATLRTNAYRTDDEGKLRSSLAVKLEPRQIPDLPEPRPRFEVWVYSPRVEGVHLRFGAVARGGLRWSDRREDFRTEILGLVKAQMVKNTVIVPVGAKGGFVARHLPDPTVDRAAWMAEGQHAYRMFVTSLLSVTDTIVAGAVVGPERVVRHDDDDPYLVVAADKGTATFSDLANEISLARGFWLGDAFASGGTNGYDHKAIGITARGAWESVKRHFQDVGIDPQNDDVTCVGIGDMSGDVFGNGMLLSHHIKLVAAFDHRHVFIDPDPDPSASFAERERLFALPRSSWADYAATAISQGGGVYARTVKAISVTAQARTALGLPDGVQSLSPAEYIHAILQAPVDLLWNGGIGTYVKATRETHADAGDRANDAVRVDATQVRARCAGEGGNLGWTQAARIEYSRAGGRINTDFIDNSAGVDTSDHEVNIKILLTDAETHGRLAEAERNELLPEMTGDVAALVLAHNVDQNQALAMARYQAARFSAIHEDWMRVLSDDGYLDRHLETMPSTSEMTRRIAAGEGLCSPELATLFAWTKIRLADIIVASDLPDDPYLADRLIQYFPKPLRERFGDLMRDHPLRREIITTVAVNRFVNSQGISSYHRLSSDTGASAADMIGAQLASRSIFRVGALEVGLRRESLDAETYVELMIAMRHLVERGTRWVLQTLGTPINVAKAVETFAGPSREVLDNLEHVAIPSVVESWTWRRDGLVEQGLSPDLARLLAAEPVAHLAPAIVLIASRASHDLLDTARRFFELRDQLELGRFFEAAEALPRTDRWSLMAQAAAKN